MQTTARSIGTTSLQINGPLALGGNVFGWTIDEPKSFEVLNAFVEAGMNFIDTADVYSAWKPGNVGGESETILGNWMHQTGNRDRVVIATKVGMEVPKGEQGLSKQHIVAGVERSLKRLRTDRIDLYQSHRDDTNTPIYQTLGAYQTLIEQGKVLAIGASNFTAERLAESLAKADAALPQYQCLQPHYNLIDRAEFEKDLGPLCLQHRVGVIPYFSLASGFLTGKYRSADDTKGKARGSRVEKYLNHRGFKILAALDTVAKNTGSNPARVAIAWLIHQPVVTAPIASATSVEQLRDLIAATELKLDAAAMGILNSASAPS